MKYQNDSSFVQTEDAILNFNQVILSGTGQKAYLKPTQVRKQNSQNSGD